LFSPPPPSPLTKSGDESELAAKKALAVLSELWRRRIWRDARTVNCIGGGLADSLVGSGVQPGRELAVAVIEGHVFWVSSNVIYATRCTAHMWDG
jgi:hypothetical protein